MDFHSVSRRNTSFLGLFGESHKNVFNIVRILTPNFAPDGIFKEKWWADFSGNTPIAVVIAPISQYTRPWVLNLFSA